MGKYKEQAAACRREVDREMKALREEFNAFHAETKRALEDIQNDLQNDIARPLRLLDKLIARQTSRSFRGVAHRRTRNPPK